MQREEMIQSARSLLYHDGLKAFSLNAILLKLNISKGSFYHHFKHRDEFIFAILSKEAQSYRYKAEEEIYKAQSLQERLIKVFDIYCIDTPKNRQICAFYEELFAYALKSEHKELFYAHFQNLKEDTAYLITQSFEMSALSAKKKKIALSLCGFLSVAIDGFFTCYPYTVLNRENIDLWEIRRDQILNFINQICILLETKHKTSKEL